MAKNRRHDGRPYYQVAKDALNKFAGGSTPIREAVQVIFSKDIPVVTSSTKVRTSIFPDVYSISFNRLQKSMLSIPSTSTTLVIPSIEVTTTSNLILHLPYL